MGADGQPGYYCSLCEGFLPQGCGWFTSEPRCWGTCQVWGRGKDVTSTVTYVKPVHRHSSPMAKALWQLWTHNLFSGICTFVFFHGCILGTRDKAHRELCEVWKKPHLAKDFQILWSGFGSRKNRKQKCPRASNGAWLKMSKQAMRLQFLWPQLEALYSSPAARSQCTPSGKKVLKSAQIQAHAIEIQRLSTRSWKMPPCLLLCCAEQWWHGSQQQPCRNMPLVSSLLDNNAVGFSCSYQESFAWKKLQGAAISFWKKKFSGDCKLCTTTEMLYMDLNISKTLGYAILKQNICMVSFYLQAHAINCGSTWLEVVVK